MTPGELLADAKALLVDFDGPLAALMPPPLNAEAADRVRRTLAGVDLPVEMLETTDHLALVRWAQLNTPASLVLDVEAACTEAELEAAATCSAGWHAPALVDLIRTRELPAAVVSNNSDLAVRAFLERAGWLQNFGAIACRTPVTVDWMKPSDQLVRLALDVLKIDAEGAVMVGDAVTDVVAAKAAGVLVLGLAKNETRANELAMAGADWIVPLLPEQDS